MDIFRNDGKLLITGSLFGVYNFGASLALVNACDVMHERTKCPVQELKQHVEIK
jgi:hypothetical protein